LICIKLTSIDQTEKKREGMKSCRSIAFPNAKHGWLNIILILLFQLAGRKPFTLFRGQPSRLPERARPVRQSLGEGERPRSTFAFLAVNKFMRTA
jgi:hypothetical protein